MREPVGRSRVIEMLGHRLQAIELPGAAEAMTLELIGLTAETTPSGLPARSAAAPNTARSSKPLAN